MSARDDIPEYINEANAATMLRVPPHSIEAESSVLGSLLLDGRAWDQVGDMLAEVDFYRAEHRTIFGAMAGMFNANRPVDVVTVFERLEAAGKADDVGGIGYLNSLAQYVPSAGAVRRYAEIVREKAVLRSLIAKSDEIATAAFNPQGKAVDQILDDAERSIMAIGEARRATDDDWEDVEDGIVRVLDNLNSRANGSLAPDYIPTGIGALDERLDGGMRPGELIVVGARPSMGKSALGLTVCANVAGRQRRRVGMFSMEMPKDQVHSRALAMVGRVPLGGIKRPERLQQHHWAGITEGVEKLRSLPLSVNDQANLTIHQIRTKARALKRRKKDLGLLLVDYLGLMRGTDAKLSRAYQLEEVTQGLKSLAKELHIPVMLLVQLSREVEKRSDQMPQLSDLRDSGAIEQDADVVMFIHRPWKADPSLGEEWKPYAKGSVAKVRDGEVGFFDMHYEGPQLHFTDWPTDMDVPSGKVRTRVAQDL